uniref:Stress response protein nst1-like protein n=1 Tax=Triatoma infestans TaxID=30076 RepID=A0A161M1N1_TRIIF
MFIIMGDFNVRVGNSDSSNEIVFTDTALNYPRLSYDEILNKRGRALLEMMNELGFEICDGRSFSDTPAHFTFLSSVGKSIIDQV